MQGSQAEVHEWVGGADWETDGWMDGWREGWRWKVGKKCMSEGE